MGSDVGTEDRAMDARRERCGRNGAPGMALAPQAVKAGPLTWDTGHLSGTKRTGRRPPGAESIQPEDGPAEPVAPPKGSTAGRFDAAARLPLPRAQRLNHEAIFTTRHSLSNQQP